MAAAAHQKGFVAPAEKMPKEVMPAIESRGVTAGEAFDFEERLIPTHFGRFPAASSFHGTTRMGSGDEC